MSLHISGGWIKKNFNGDIEMGRIPPVLSETNIEELLQGYENHFGKGMKKVKNESPFKKNQVFLFIILET